MAPPVVFCVLYQFDCEWYPVVSLLLQNLLGIGAKLFDANHHQIYVVVNFFCNLCCHELAPSKVLSLLTHEREPEVDKCESWFFEEIIAFRCTESFADFNDDVEGCRVEPREVGQVLFPPVREDRQDQVVQKFCLLIKCESSNETRPFLFAITCQSIRKRYIINDLTHGNRIFKVVDHEVLACPNLSLLSDLYGG